MEQLSNELAEQLASQLNQPRLETHRQICQEALASIFQLHQDTRTIVSSLEETRPTAGEILLSLVARHHGHQTGIPELPPSVPSQSFVTSNGDQAVELARPILGSQFAEHGSISQQIRHPLWVAAATGDGSLLKLLLEKAAKASRRPHLDLSLNVATLLGHHDIIRILTNNGAHTSTVDHAGNTLLHHAVQRGHGDIVQLLIDIGIDMEATNKAGQTALGLVARQKNDEAIMQLLDFGADINKPFLTEELNNARQTRLMTVLGYASREGNRSLVRSLLKRGAATENPGAGPHYRSPLYLAISRKHPAIAKILLDAGADVRGREEGRSTALHRAAYLDDVESIELLLDHGAAVNEEPTRGLLPIRSALTGQAYHAVSFLLSRGAFVDVRQRGFIDYLHTIIDEGNLTAISVLLDRVSEHGGIRSVFCYAIMPAVRSGSRDFVSLLLQRSVGHLQHRDLDDALCYAAKAGQDEIVAVLLQYGYGANMNGTDATGLAALHHAACRGHVSVVRLLLSEGADINRWSPVGTPLIIALDQGQAAVVCLLLQEYNPRIHAPNPAQREMLRAARRQGTEAIVEATRQWGILNREVLATSASLDWDVDESMMSLQ